jgi:Ca-activated chloride channel family protein
MNKLISFFDRTLKWLESDASAAWLALPLGRLDYSHHVNAQVVVLAIDVSPSMGQADYPPSRLEGAVRAARRYLNTLAKAESPTLVGIVDFHGQAQLVSHPLPATSHHQQLLGSLNGLHTGQGTNIGAALSLASRELALVPSATRPTILLLTDGDSNQGPDPVKVAEGLKARGMQLDIIGIGGSPAEVNESDLKRMASETGGQLRYWFIDSVDALVQRFEALALREIK